MLVYLQTLCNEYFDIHKQIQNTVPVLTDFMTFVVFFSKMLKSTPNIRKKKISTKITKENFKEST